MNKSKLLRVVSLVTALLIGGYVGYYFTNNYYVAENKRENNEEIISDNDVICRLELRNGNKGDIKTKYYALLEWGDNKNECESIMITDKLPKDLTVFTIGSIHNELFE